MSGLIVTSLRRRLARTILTATGIGVGVAAIVALIALGDGLKHSASGFVHLGRADIGLFQKGVSDPTASVLPTSMVTELEQQPGIAEATPIQLVIESILHQPSAIVFGIDPDSFAGQRLVITAGTRATAPRTVIVGDQFAKQAHLQPGSPLKIKGKPYTVSGIFHSGVTFEDSGVVMGLRRPRRSRGIWVAQPRSRSPSSATRGQGPPRRRSSVASPARWRSTTPARPRARMPTACSSARRCS